MALMRLTSKRYALTLIAVCFAAFVAVVAANVLIDPQRMFGTELFPLKLNANDRYRHYLEYRAAEPRIEGLLFASSRGNGIPVDVLSARTGNIAFANFTVASGMITDHLPMLERAIKDKAARGERLKHVFLMIDPDLFGERPSTNRNPQTQLHPDLTGEDPVRFWIRYLTAIQFRAWRDDVRRNRSASSARPASARLVPDVALPRVQLAALGNTLSFPPPGQPMRPTTRPDYQRQLALVRRFAELCRDHGVNLIAVTPPLHRTLLAYYDRDDLAAVVTDLSRVTPIWDFGAPAWLSDRHELWTDHSHFTTEVGRMMIDRVVTGALPEGNLPFGVRR